MPRSAPWSTGSTISGGPGAGSDGDKEVTSALEPLPDACHIRWRRVDISGSEEAGIARTSNGWRLQGRVEVEESGVLAQLAYVIECERNWHTRSALVTGSVAGVPIVLQLHSDGAGRWTLNGVPIHGVDGTLDIDLGFSPATNLLPIRRLDLDVGECAKFDAAWVRFPELCVEKLGQAYRSEAARVYRYDALVDGTPFRARLDTDEFGRVVHYEGLWVAEPGPRHLPR